MAPKDHLAAGPTPKVVVLKGASIAPYPKLESLKLTSLESQKCLLKKCCKPWHFRFSSMECYIEPLALYRAKKITKKFSTMECYIEPRMLGSFKTIKVSSIMFGWNFFLCIESPLSNGVQFIGLRWVFLPLLLNYKKDVWFYIEQTI